MEVVMGHLGRLEFITSGETAFNKIGELVRLARQIVQKAHRKGVPGLTYFPDLIQSVWLNKV